MKKRLLRRSETSGRIDDNVATFKKRYGGYLEEYVPVVERLRTAKATLIEVSSSDRPVSTFLTLSRFPQLRMEKKDGSNFEMRWW